jgi:hypothetical protein
MVTVMDMNADELNAMTPAERTARLSHMREVARVDANYSKAVCTHRTRMLDSWMVVEPREERWKREDDERQARREGERVAKRVERTEALREQRAHELAMARMYAKAYEGNGGNGNGVDTIDWSEVLAAITDTLNNLANRVESLEQRVTRLEATGDAINGQLQSNTARAEAAAEKVENSLKGSIEGLKSDVGFLKFRIDALVSKRMQFPEQHIVIHSDR